MDLKMSLRLDPFYQTEVLRSVVLKVEVFAGWQLWLVQGLGMASWKCWQRISKFSIFLYIFRVLLQHLWFLYIDGVEGTGRQRFKWPWLCVWQPWRRICNINYVFESHEWEFVTLAKHMGSCPFLNFKWHVAGLRMLPFEWADGLLRILPFEWADGLLQMLLRMDPLSASSTGPFLNSNWRTLL